MTSTRPPGSNPPPGPSSSDPMPSLGSHGSRLDYDQGQQGQRSVSSPIERILQALTWERWLLLLILFAGTGYGLWQWLAPKGAPSGMGGPPGAMQGPPPRPVVTTALQTGSAAQVVQVLGQVEASEDATLRSQTSGTVVSILVKEGDSVKEGDIIAQLDQSDQILALAEAQAQLAEAESRLAELEKGTRSEVISQRAAALQASKTREAEARDNLKRVQSLVSEGALAERQLIEAKASLDGVVSDRLAAEASLADAQAGPRVDELAAERAKVAAEQAAVTQARLELQRTEIRAAASGVVSDRLVNAGDYVENADPILTLINNDTVDITLELPEQLSGTVQPGQPIKLISRAIPGWQAEATIDALLPLASAASRRRPARVRLQNPPPGLLPGTAVAAQFEDPGNSSGYQISRDALTRRSNEWLVFAVQEGVVQEIPVVMVSDLGETVIIDSPKLRPQQVIVLKGGDALSDGAAVMVVDGPGKMPPPGEAGQ